MSYPPRFVFLCIFYVSLNVEKWSWREYLGFQEMWIDLGACAALRKRSCQITTTSQSSFILPPTLILSHFECRNQEHVHVVSGTELSQGIYVNYPCLERQEQKQQFNWTPASDFISVIKMRWNPPKFSITNNSGRCRSWKGDPVSIGLRRPLMRFIKLRMQLT